MKIHVSQDGKIFINGEYAGFIEGETIYVIENDSSRPIGDFEHRSEIVGIVQEWKEGRR